MFFLVQIVVACVVFTFAIVTACCDFVASRTPRLFLFLDGCAIAGSNHPHFRLIFSFKWKIWKNNNKVFTSVLPITSL